MNNTLKSPSKERPPNKIKMAECTFFEKTVYCTTMQMVLNERTPKNAGVSSFRFFIYLRGPCALKNRNDDPPAFLGVLSNGTICNAVQCIVFSEKGWGHLQRRAMHRFPGERNIVIFEFFFYFLRDKVQKICEMTHLHFWSFFHLGP